MHRFQKFYQLQLYFGLEALKRAKILFDFDTSQSSLLFLSQAILVNSYIYSKKMQKEIVFFELVFLRINLLHIGWLIKFLKSMHLEKKIFWFPCSNLTDIKLKEFLTEKKAKLMQQTIYYNRLPGKSESAMLHYLQNDPPDWMLFSSPSTFRHLLFIMDKHGLKFSSKVAALGETTAEFIQAKGYKIHKIAEEKNILKLICEIIDKENL